MIVLLDLSLIWRKGFVNSKRDISHKNWVSTEIFHFEENSIAWWNATKSKAIKFQVFITIIPWAYNRFWKLYTHIIKQACEPLVCWNECLQFMVRFFQDKDLIIEFFLTFWWVLWMIKILIFLLIFQTSDWPTCYFDNLKYSLRRVTEKWSNLHCLLSWIVLNINRLTLYHSWANFLLWKIKYLKGVVSC